MHPPTCGARSDLTNFVLSFNTGCMNLSSVKSQWSAFVDEADHSKGCRPKWAKTITQTLYLEGVKHLKAVCTIAVPALRVAPQPRVLKMPWFWEGGQVYLLLWGNWPHSETPENRGQNQDPIYRCLMMIDDLKLFGKRTASSGKEFGLNLGSSLFSR